MKFIFLGRDSVFSVSESSPGGPLWPLNSGPFACLYPGGPQITRPPSEKVACLSQNTKKTNTNNIVSLKIQNKNIKNICLSLKIQIQKIPFEKVGARLFQIQSNFFLEIMKPENVCLV